MLWGNAEFPLYTYVNAVGKCLNSKSKREAKALHAHLYVQGKWKANSVHLLSPSGKPLPLNFNFSPSLLQQFPACEVLLQPGDGTREPSNVSLRTLRTESKGIVKSDFPGDYVKSAR